MSNEHMNKTLSESDLTQVKPSPDFVLSRQKRRREADEDSDICRSSFKEEVKELITSLMAKQQTEINNLEPVLSDIQQSNLKIESSISFLTSQNEELKKKITQLELQTRKDKDYITILENKIEDFQMTQRKANFGIKNVPKVPGETKSDLVQMVLSLAETVDCKVEKRDICDIYRVKSKNEASNSPIVVETTSTLLKLDFMKTCKTFNIKNKTKLCAKHLGMRKKEDTPIFLSENLTPKGSRLHFLARDLVKTKNYRYCWTAYGKIYVRKDDNSPIVLISSEDQVQHLLQGS
ncbi:uncharacterized protein LOC132904195 [Amyelois transitella]|uniref:uncharacterized protein LOC132904195 n=1 Tax=Amyelois transitella TaxID=680683 RepID=UPI00298FB104|nr:uncharacterized protein LOC132904195 [Amyelois transitella]